MSEFSALYGGTLWAIREWEQWDRLVARLQEEADDGWYVYPVGQGLPSHPLDAATFRSVLGGISALLHRDHQEYYLGIVYADDRECPRLVKIYDPNSLGSSCGSSGRLVPPGWVLSRMPPDPVSGPKVVPENRKQWWKQLFSG